MNGEQLVLQLVENNIGVHKMTHDSMNPADSLAC